MKKERKRLYFYPNIIPEIDSRMKWSMYYVKKH